MLLNLLLPLAFSVLAFATSQPDSSAIGFTLLGALQPVVLLVKRQTVDETGAINGLTNLITEAVSAVSSGGQCSAECTPWSNDMQTCAALGSEEEIGKCACGSGPLGNMEPCAACFSAEKDVTNFSDLCDSLSAGSGASSFSAATPSTSPPTTTASSGGSASTTSSTGTPSGGKASTGGAPKLGGGAVAAGSVGALLGAVVLAWWC